MAATQDFLGDEAPVPREHPHDWVAKINDVGDIYELCLTCGKQTHWEPMAASVEALSALHTTHSPLGNAR